jgi:uncharacterized protein
MANNAPVDALTKRSVESFLAGVRALHPVAEAWLFGSRARGDARTDSDADLAVILNGPKRRSIDVIEEMADAQFEVLLETGRLVSVLPISAEEWREPALHTNPYLIENIKREGIRL